MSTIQDYSAKILPDSQINYNGNYQTKSYLKHSKANDFFEYLYSYPPKFTLKWDSVDELTQDLLLENNYGVLEHSFPFIDFVEDCNYYEFILYLSGLTKYMKLMRNKEGFHKYS